MTAAHITTYHCPKEHQQHLELAANFPKINVAYTNIVTISTDTHHSSQEFRNSVGAQWPFLSDPGRIVQKDLEIQEYTNPENDPMIPHTLVLGPRIRPDWDLGAPGLREAWEAGEHSPFPGWNRRDAVHPSTA